MMKSINQSAARSDPASKRTLDPNERPDDQTKQPGDIPRDDSVDAEDAHARAAEVRDAGPESMKKPPRTWSQEDEESDESFPASDPPANY